MSRIILIIMGVFLPLISIAQNFNPQSWDEVAQYVAEGNEQAAVFLLNAKTEIEQKSKWAKEDKDNYLTVISLLVEFTSRKGWYKDEETFLKEAMRNFNEKDSIANSPYTRRLWLTMTRLQKDLGDADALLNYGQQALTMFEEVQDYNYDYYLLLHNIALGYWMKKDYLSAKLYIDEAVSYVEPLEIAKTVPWDWAAPFYNTQGFIEQELGHYDSAIEKFNKVISTPPSDNLVSVYWLAVNNLSVLYTKQGDYTKAKSLLASIPDGKTPELAVNKYQNLLVLSYLNGDNTDILTFQKTHNDTQYLNALNIAKAFSETERENFFKTWGPEMIFVNNLLSDKFPEVTSDALDANLVARWIEMAVNISLKDIIKTDTTEIGRNLMQRREALLKKDLISEKKDSLRRDIIEYEKKLLRSNPDVISKIVDEVGSFSTIIRQLKEHEALVVFTYVPEMDCPTAVNPFYGAYIILPDSPCAHLVKLCNVDEVEDVFYNSNPSIEFISELYGSEKASKLYEMLWSPLIPLLSDANTIYYATSGPLGQLNHEAFLDDAGKRLGFLKDLRLVSNPAKLNKFSDKSVSISDSDVVLFGFPNFNVSIDKMIANAETYSTYSGSDISTELALRGEVLRDGWTLLPGTKEEIDEIKSAIKGRKPKSLRTFIDNDATEEAVKGLSGHSPAVLHIATHGFVISSQLQYDQSQFAQSLSGISDKNRYMLWSGLILSGGNNTWKGMKIPSNVEDGILTADEISRLDLSNTNLVVLSACETGRGHIDPVDGVWGLQRAFKLAGVKSILMTLWKIPDATTAMFMGEFYRKLAEGFTPRQSLRCAQKYLIDNGASEPFYWAPFIILD